MQKKSLTEAKHFTREIRLIIVVSKVRTAEVIKKGVLPIDVSSICIKFENFMQVGCRDQGQHFKCTKYCRKPIILP